MHDDDHDDYDGFEPGDDDDHLPVDVPLPDYVAALEPTATLVELAAAYAKTKKKDDRNERLRFAIDHDWYKIMLGRMMIARLSYEHFSARRITSKDGAAVMAAYDEFGKKHCNVERAQWRKYLRLSKSIGEIHEHTLAMQKEQAAAGKRLTFPSLNMLDREWFPADPDAAEFREIKRQAAEDAEQALRNRKAEERNKEFMEAVDKEIEARKALDREKQERWDAETELRRQIADRDARIAQLTEGADSPEGEQIAQPASDEQITELRENLNAARSERDFSDDKLMDNTNEQRKALDELHSENRRKAEIERSNDELVAPTDELETLRATLAEREEQIRQLTTRLAEVEARLAATHEPPPDPEPPTDLPPVGTEPPVDDAADDSPTEPSGEPVEATEPTPSGPPVEPPREPEPVVDRRAAVVDLLPNPASSGIATRDLSARLGFDARTTLEDLIIEKRAALQDTTTANPEEWRWTLYPDAPEPVEPSAEPMEGPPTEQATETGANEVVYWAELDAVSAARLCERVLTAADFPDLTSDRLPDEEKELGFDRRGRALKPTKRSEPGDLDIRARRLKLVTIRCAQLLGLTEQVELLKEKSRQWFAERRHLTVGQVIRAVHPLIEPMKDIPNAEDVD